MRKIPREYYTVLEHLWMHLKGFAAPDLYQGTHVLVVNQFQGGYYGQADTYLVEHCGMYFPMTLQQLESEL